MAGCCGPAITATPGEPPAIASAGSGGIDRGRWVSIPGGNARIGSDDPEGFESDGEGPARTVRLSPYRISATTVSNAQFAAFVVATGHQTEAELAGESFVFYLQLAPEARARIRRVVTGVPWWLIVPGASWREPLGPGSHWQSIADHPVVHVSWNDALAYCQWCHAALPSEAQWEHAARGARTGLRYPWGNELEPAGERRCNIWQGDFPNAPADDWSPGTMPVDSFPANGFGLHNTSGNVWEWCADWFNADYHRRTADVDPLDQRVSGRRSQRGGSFLCHASYCNRYRSAARGANTPSTATSHTGFRVIGIT